MHLLVRSGLSSKQVIRTVIFQVFTIRSAVRNSKEKGCIFWESSQYCEKRLLASTCLSAWSSSVPRGRIVLKCNIWNSVPPQPCHQQAAPSVHYTTDCKHILVLLRIGEIIARNILSWLKLLRKIIIVACSWLFILLYQWCTVTQTSNSWKASTCMT